MRDSDPVAALQERLAAIGYAVLPSGVIDSATKAALIEFQRRFRPATIDGVDDDETRALLAGLTRL